MTPLQLLLLNTQLLHRFMILIYICGSTVSVSVTEVIILPFILVYFSWAKAVQFLLFFIGTSIWLISMFPF